MKQLTALFASVCLAACLAETKEADSDHGHHGHDHAAHEHDHGHEGHDHGHDDHGGLEVKVSAAAQKSIGLRTVTIQKRAVTSTMALHGRFERTPDSGFAMGTTVAGRIRLMVRPLQPVTKGMPLFAVRSLELQARDREIALLEKRLAAYTETGLKNAELAAQLEMKRSERVSFVGDAEVTEDGLLFRAGEDGTVNELLVAEGAQVEAGQNAVSCIRPRQLRFRAFACPSEVARLTDGMPAQCKGTAGRIRLDPSGEGENVFVEFPAGAPDARSGERGQAEIVLANAAPADFAVPSAAIVKRGLEPIVFVKDEDEPDTFLAIPVEPGVTGGGWTAIHGIDDPDAEVVVEGAYELKLALPAPGGEAKAAGHFHADGTFHEGTD